MTYQVRTAVFDGPLDILLQLITRRQLDITELSLVDLVADYLRALDEMRELDLEVTSEFLLIAATLIQLKARWLLPGDLEAELDDDLALMEERDRLLARLLACATFKDVAAVLAHRLEAGERFVPRTVGFEPTEEVRMPEVRLDLGVHELAELASRLFHRRREPDLDHLDLELPSVEEAIGDLRERLAKVVEADFATLVTHCTRRVEVVAYFLAMLELARWGAIEVHQEDWLSAIRITRGERISDGGVSEW